MSVFQDPYETTIGQTLDRSYLERLKKTLQISIVQDGQTSLRRMDVVQTGEHRSLFITGILPTEAEVPLFTHPIKIFTQDDKKYICTDVRMFVQKDQYDGANFDKCIRNRAEFNFAMVRHILETLWLDGEKTRIRADLGFAGAVYSAVISEALTRAYALDPGDKAVVSILAGAFYGSCFEEVDTLTEEIRQRWAMSIQNFTKIPSEMVFRILDQVEVIKDVNEFCANVVGLVENVRLKNFNAVGLLTLIRNMWYGTNSKEIISVALEHPPTFCAIVYSAMNERTFKNSPVCKTAEVVGKRGLGADFIKNVSMIVKDRLEEKNVRATESIEDRIAKL